MSVVNGQFMFMLGNRESKGGLVFSSYFFFKCCCTHKDKHTFTLIPFILFICTSQPKQNHPLTNFNLNSTLKLTP